MREETIMEMRFWEDNSLHSHVKYDSNSNDNIPPRAYDSNYSEVAKLNFSTGPDDCMENTGCRKTQIRATRQDLSSHRIIEKRRRDRMNNCLADLARLIPTEYLKKGRSRLEKTEIIQLAIKHIKHLQYLNQYRFGYQECVSETMKFMMEMEGNCPQGQEPFCVKLLGHLQKHCDNIRSGTMDAQIQHKSRSERDRAEAKIEPNNEYDEVVLHRNEETLKRRDQHQEHDDGVLQEHLSNGYKYKNDIKMRFSQDNAKRSKLGDRRTSTPTSTENQTCSSRGSPNCIYHVNDIMPTIPGVKSHLIHDLERRISTRSPWLIADSTLNGTSLSNSSNQYTPQSNIISNGNILSAQGYNNKTNFHVPAFVLHTKGAFYIPVTLEYQAVLPYLGNYDLLHNNDHSDIILHPIAINIKFQESQRRMQPLNLQQPN